jgi:hypothetical protein
MPKEAAMKDKYLNAVILVVVASGTVMAAFVGNASQGGPLQTVFFAFVAAIIAIQLVPALMLIGTLLKGILTRSEKELEH